MLSGTHGRRRRRGGSELSQLVDVVCSLLPVVEVRIKRREKQLTLPRTPHNRLRCFLIMYSAHLYCGQPAPRRRVSGAEKGGTCETSREEETLAVILCTHFRPFSTISRGVSRYLYSERMILQHPYPAQRCYRQPSLNIPAPRKNKLGCEVEGRSRSSREDGGKERRKTRIGTEGGCKDKRSRGEVGRTQGD